MTSSRLDSLFDEVYPALHAYCVGLTGDGDLAHDASQEAFVRLVRKKVTGDPPALKVWLFKVATHFIRDRYRIERNRKRLMAQNPPAETHADSPELDLERTEDIARVRAAMDRLQPRDREMLLMRYEGFSYKEVADALGVAATSVGTLLARAQRRFSSALEGEGTDD